MEAEVVLKGARGRAIAPAGASTGSGEAKSLDALEAVHNVRTAIRAALLGVDARDQAGVDAKLTALDGTPDNRALGANAIVAVSLACAHPSAAAARKPLWRHLAGDKPVAMPVPQVQIFGGGAHARGRVDLQDYMVICVGAGSFAESLEWTAEIYKAAGARLARKNAAQGVADEGGWWPAFKSNEEGLEELTGAIADAGFEAGSDVAIALDEGVLPFRIDRNRVRDDIPGWRSKWFAPGRLARAALVDTVHSLYIPYWTFDATAHCPWEAEAGYHYYVDVEGRDSKGNRVVRKEQRTRWEPASGVVDHAFDDDPVPGTQGLPMDLLRQVEPFPTQEVVPYDTAFLSGHVVEHYRVVLLEAAEQSQRQMHAALERLCAAQVPGDTHRNSAHPPDVFGAHLQARAGPDLAAHLQLRRQSVPGDQ